MHRYSLLVFHGICFQARNMFSIAETFSTIPKSIKLLLGRMKPRLITSSTISVKPVITFLVCILFLLFLAISMISIKPTRIGLRSSARKLFGLKRPTPKFCSQFVRRESVNWNYFYYYKNPATQQELVWCKVPKAGSTTLTKLFLRLAGSKYYNNNTRVHKLLRDFYPRLPNQLMLDKMKISRTFLVVRDPFERILSAYRDKLENYERDMIYRDGYYYEHYGKFMVNSAGGGHNLLNSSVNNGTLLVPLPNRTSFTSDIQNGTNNITTRKEPTWKEFVQYLLKTSVARYDEHWMPITRLCSPCNVQFDYIVKMENFDREIQLPLKSAGITAIDLGVNHMTGTANNRLVDKYFKSLSLGEVKKLYTRYKRDFLLFGYTPFKYFRLVSKKSKETNSSRIN